jgi:hypothetical protein
LAAIWGHASVTAAIQGAAVIPIVAWGGSFGDVGSCPRTSP